MADQSFVLTGNTEEELKSYHAFMIIATCMYGQIPLIRRAKSSDNDDVTVSSPSPPPTGHRSLTLQKNMNHQMCSISTINAMLRLLGASSSKHSLLGFTALEQSIVDSWLYYGWSSLDVPIEALVASSSNKQILTDFQESIQILDTNLLYRTYIAGSDAITIADIRLAASLWYGAQKQLWKPDEEPDELMNAKRWYQTIVNQDWFMQSVALLPTLDGTTTSGTTTKAINAPNGNDYGGVLLNGLPTPVINQKYKRQRIRMKEIFGSDGGKSYVGSIVTVAGWSRTVRKASSKLLFIELNDGSIGSSLQCVLDVQITEGFEACKTNGGTGSSFQFVGEVVASGGTEQVIDLKVTKATLLGAVYGGNAEGTVVGGMLYPLSKKEHTLEHMRDVAHLRARGQIHAAAMRIRHAMAYATHTFFHNHGFLYIHTPIITGADCEGAGEQFAITTMFGSDHLKPDITIPVHPLPTATTTEGGEAGATTEDIEENKMSKSEMKRLAKQKAKAEKAAASGQAVAVAVDEPAHEIVPGAIDYTKDFFGQRVNLTVSGQLNVETHACALSDVYTFGPTFRAEESRTYRHLSEFWMIEPEIAFATLSDDIDLAEDYLKYCVRFALENCTTDLEFFENNPHGEKGLRQRLKNVLDNEFKRITYTEAIEILQRAVKEDGIVFEKEPLWGMDLPSEHERYICEKVFKMPTVLTNYPKEIKAFYMKLNDDQKTVAAADILVPKIGEIIGGSQREHRYEVLRQRCIEMNIDPKNVWWYLDLRRYGTVPHAGFGLGFERLILFITGLDNIRDVIPFPRWVGNAKF